MSKFLLEELKHSTYVNKTKRMKKENKNNKHRLKNKN
jgi:hypothetical protein